MATSWVVRAARRPADGPGIDATMLESALVAYRNIFPGATSGDFASATATWWPVPSPPAIATFVIEDAGTVVGTISIFRTGEGHARIEGFYVRPNYQRRGVGRALWDRALRILADNGYNMVDLWVVAENNTARAAYEALGCTLGFGLQRVDDRWFAERSGRAL